MTEKHEKAERAATMRERNCSELEAVYAIAERIAKSRRGQRISGHSHPLLTQIITRINISLDQCRVRIS